MARKASTPPKTIYRLKITLQGVRPPIWRRIEVPGNTRLDHLHLMIQATMGWTNGHLHSFTIGEATFSLAEPEFDSEDENEKKFRLDKVVTDEKSRFRYEYDFGDGWEHMVLVEKIAPPEPSVDYPRCLAGARACPPEDVGGTPGYANFLEALRDPKHEDHASCIEWRGSYDPEAFDLSRADTAIMNFQLMQNDTM